MYAWIYIYLCALASLHGNKKIEDKYMLRMYVWNGFVHVWRRSESGLLDSGVGIRAPVRPHILGHGRRPGHGRSRDSPCGPRGLAALLYHLLSTVKDIDLCRVCVYSYMDGWMYKTMKVKKSACGTGVAPGTAPPTRQMPRVFRLDLKGYYTLWGRGNEGR